MLISHDLDADMLHVTLHRDLDIATRAAAVQEFEALVHTHGPKRVTLHVPAGEPTPATLSTHRMCQSLGIPLELAGASTATHRLFAANTT
ncbi:hypothetical protein [Streptomyces sp. NRRL B-24572]|uniref:hypothetical protein n=1 Tax=Streptomyces sp. NRRL B-24572 TaxID=1962156 RepID=UPI000A39DB0F|nr:hypothetical protein [Streptomyces sp. NRRL B-24572]